MGYKKIRYNTGDGIAKIRMEDDTGAIVENWTIHWSDLKKWVSQMERKYGINMKARTKDADLDWLK